MLPSWSNALEFRGFMCYHVLYANKHLNGNVAVSALTSLPTGRPCRTQGIAKSKSDNLSSSKLFSSSHQSCLAWVRPSRRATCKLQWFPEVPSLVKRSYRP